MLSTSLIRTIKRAALEAVENSKPVNIVIGKVISIQPLSIRLNQKLTIESRAIMETSSCSNLSVNDEVVLIRCQGGQKYIVLDVVE